MNPPASVSFFCLNMHIFACLDLIFFIHCSFFSSYSINLEWGGNCSIALCLGIIRIWNSITFNQEAAEMFCTNAKVNTFQFQICKKKPFHFPVLIYFSSHSLTFWILLVKVMGMSEFCGSSIVAGSVASAELASLEIGMPVHKTCYSEIYIL